MFLPKYYIPIEPKNSIKNLPVLQDIETPSFSFSWEGNGSPSMNIDPTPHNKYSRHGILLLSADRAPAFVFEYMPGRLNEHRRVGGDR